MILEDVQPVAPLDTLHGDPGPDDLGQPVDVERHDVELALALQTPLLAPGLGPQDAHTQLERLHVHTHLFAGLGQIEGIRGGAADGGGPEILQQHDLLLGAAPGHGDHAGTEPFGPVVGPQPAGEEPVAVGVVDDVVAGQPGGGKRARHELGPGLDVTLGVAHHRGLARGARRGVHPHHVAHGHGEQPKGVAVTQVLLGGKGQAPQIIQRADVIRAHPGLVEGLAVEAHRVVDALGHLPQAFELQGLQRLARQRLEFLVKNHTKPPIPQKICAGRPLEAQAPRMAGQVSYALLPREGIPYRRSPTLEHRSGLPRPGPGRL